MIWRWKKQIRVKKGLALEEAELNLTLGAIADEHPLWRAVHYLIDVAEENANENASENMDPPGILAGYVGGARHLRLLRDELYSRREIGRELMRK